MAAVFNGKKATMQVNITESGISTDGTYTNETPTVSAHGGIAAGTTFDKVPYSDMFTKILYPYIAPSVSASSTPNGGTYEKGNAQTVTAIKATITKKSAAIVKVEALDGSTVLGTETSEDFGSGTVTFTVSVSVSTNKNFTVRVTDGENKTVTASTGTFSFIYPYYYGVADADATVDETLIKTFTKLVQAKSAKSISYTANNQKMVFVSPYSVSKITDPNGFDVTDTFTMTRVSVTGLDETAQSYYVYTANEASTVSNFTMKFTH